MRTFIAIVLGLASASGVYWYQNPDLELKVPEGLIAQFEERVSVSKQVPESFAKIAATSTAAPATNNTVESTRKQSGDGITDEKSVDVVSELEKRVHAGINSARATHGVSPQLGWDTHLARVARAHSEDMTRRGYFRHSNLEGLDPTDRAKAAGYSFREAGCYGLGENLTIVLEHPSLEHMSAKAVLSWMGSPGHRMNLLDGDYERTGIGASFGSWRGYESRVPDAGVLLGVGCFAASRWRTEHPV